MKTREFIEGFIEAKKADLGIRQTYDNLLKELQIELLLDIRELLSERNKNLAKYPLSKNEPHLDGEFNPVEIIANKTNLLHTMKQKSKEKFAAKTDPKNKKEKNK